MSCDIDSDSFHGTKKGGTRKTVSKRKAYVNTPRQLNTKKQKALKIINNSTANVLMSDRFDYGKSSDGKYVIGILHRIRDLVNDI